MYLKDNKLYIKKINFKINLNKVSNRTIYLILLVFMWVLFAFNTRNNDRDNYLSLFTLITDFGQFDSNIEVGFQFLIQIAGNLGLNYEMFQAILATFFLLGISYFIKKYSMNPTLSLLVYAIFPFVIDTIQIRNTLACMFIIIGLSKLLLAVEGKNKVKNIFFNCYVVP